jgi:tetratricopeptide (TPR) repeat protein
MKEYGANDKIEKAKQLEIAAIEAAQSKEFSKSLEIFNQAIQIAPTWASAYNNRAQALQLIGDTQGNLNS